MSYEQRLKEYRSQVESFLPDYLPEASNTPKELIEAMQYSLMAGGKRVRPVLVLATADLFEEGASGHRSVKAYAAALEMIHTYSLIHDDLPSMDNDTLRRGKPTSHVVYGEATAILAGDALLNRAFELMALAAKESEDSRGILQAWSELGRLAGSRGMIGGQILDLAAEGKTVDLAYLREMQGLKTGALIEAAVAGVAELFQANEETKAALKEYAKQVGFAFQIRDDILDVSANETLLGKTPGKDAQNAKATYVTLLGKEQADQYLLEANQAALSACRKLTENGFNSDFLRFYAGYLSGRRY